MARNAIVPSALDDGHARENPAARRTGGVNRLVVRLLGSGVSPVVFLVVTLAELLGDRRSGHREMAATTSALTALTLHRLVDRDSAGGNRDSGLLRGVRRGRGGGRRGR
ncbi:hypothetical protein H074_26052 [Amycolatopsis decaplanina DSM 44594]|uniref:Uncharacterized protein n=1 Tax=Amycolatopsis decaplanina DSM 44594 TaxID=1284240 RepID=M2YJZ1_9PSEU|nr:hypothetical protein H074_26052 [Amycolatopsis decaplanina DSM 44594]